MILKASERGNAAELARHLMNTRDNDHVTLHEIRGFLSGDLAGALMEADAISQGTRCKNFLFSLSLNPPEKESVSLEVFEVAVEMAEQRLGLDGQPRAIVFHEKEGRRHAHAVWSRIDAETMTARNLPFYKQRLTELSRELYLEHGWEMPRGLLDRALRNPLNFSREEWQQAKRAQIDPRLLKAGFQDCWKRSDNADALQAALEEKGYFLARGDRRGVVALDWRGEAYALSRYCGVKAKDVAVRMGDAAHLPSVAERQRWLAQRMAGKLAGWARDEAARHEKQALAVKFQREQMVQRQRALRREQDMVQAQRQEAEQRRRAARVPKGVRGVWGWVTGQNRKIKIQNELDAQRAQERDRTERESMIQKQLAERRQLQGRVKAARAQQNEAMQELTRDVAHYVRLGRDAPSVPSPAKEPKRARTRKDGRERERGAWRGDAPDFDL
ncbi:relaxase/mobilization nuclease domain-containing protein [Paracoccus sp. DMF-8]|uniref:relaxase/mobilization nuclease domain-containing protein n=1 Tax=Paracoccus sp. DMF-8 TaxID=3019445 RepID=UPI0023E84874|nr:relaxase/mobilization nuclease domain-containing protein [Paracoccus sp. DMF-8]MDF3606223.1 relaxase/mobilization nuclease domain-containing protein [Paracoccus sp. DMF-8]